MITTHTSVNIWTRGVDGSGGTFQIRPQKDFTSRRGRDRLLSLNFLSELPMEASQLLTSDPDDVNNAYDFMRRRIDVKGDPTIKRWNASIRMANFASFDQSPLCVSIEAGCARLSHLYQ
jgi:DNA mismatch repair protein MSH5